jgi:AraC-like DNA-binding protein
VTATCCPHFGLLLGQKYDLAYAGPAGFACMTAGTVGKALETLSEFLVLSDEGGTLSLESSGEIAKAAYHVHVEGLTAIENIQDMALASIYIALTALCGKRWTPVEVWLSRKRPANSRPYQQFYGAPVLFDASEHAILFNSACLQQPLPTANPYLHQFLTGIINQAKESSPLNLEQELQQQLSLCVFTGDTSLEKVARRIGMHPRTLNRRLKKKGTSFREIREDVLRRTAGHLIRNTRMAIVEIAAIMGYSDSSSFNHAFQRWYGVSPLKWRNDLNEEYLGPD